MPNTKLDSPSIDLHLHSGFSVDNENISPEEWAEFIYKVKESRLPGLKGIALTDHNNMVGVEPNLDALRKLERRKGVEPLEFIPGVECALEHENVSAHIIAYFVPGENEKIEDALHRATQINPLLEIINTEFTRRKYGVLALETANAHMRNKLGDAFEHPITIKEMDAVMREELPVYELDNWIFKPTYEDGSMTKNRITELNHRQLEKLLCGNHESGDIKRNWVDPKEAEILVKRGGVLYPENFPGYSVLKGIEQIHEAGAFASFAHPQLTIRSLCEKKLGNKIKDEGVKGGLKLDRVKDIQIKYSALDETLVEFQDFLEKEMIPRGLNAIELTNHYSYLMAEFAYMTISLLMFVDNYNRRNPNNRLYVTGGSDFHKPVGNRNIGTVNTMCEKGVQQLIEIYSKMDSGSRPRFDEGTIKQLHEIIMTGTRDIYTTDNSANEFTRVIPYYQLTRMKEAEKDPKSGLYLLPGSVKSE